MKKHKTTYPLNMSFMYKCYHPCQGKTFTATVKAAGLDIPV